MQDTGHKRDSHRLFLSFYTIAEIPTNIQCKVCVCGGGVI